MEAQPAVLDAAVAGELAPPGDFHARPRALDHEGRDARARWAALHAVRRAATSVTIPVIGIGGIRTADDVMEFVVAGATAVQVGTQNFVDPAAAVSIVARLEEWAAEGHVPSLSALRGTLRTPRDSPA